MKKNSFAILAAFAFVPVFAGAQATLIDDFSGGVTNGNEPSAPVYGAWYDAHDQAFGTPSASGGQLRIEDGGFTNGQYIIYNAVVPSTGSFTVSAIMSLVENTNFNGIRAMQIGAEVGASAVHRPSTGAINDLLPGLTNSGTYAGTLNTSDNSANPPEYVETNLFAATAGDDLLIAVGTDVTSGGWNVNSGTWGVGLCAILVDDIKLELNGLPVELDSFQVD